jgi:hypothetical protein
MESGAKLDDRQGLSQREIGAVSGRWTLPASAKSRCRTGSGTSWWHLVNRCGRISGSGSNSSLS